MNPKRSSSPAATGGGPMDPRPNRGAPVGGGIQHSGMTKRVCRLVVKIGSSLLTKDGGHLDDRRIGAFVAEMAGLHKSGIEVIIVSSGAIAAGVGELGWGKKPSDLAKKQAAAA